MLAPVDPDEDISDSSRSIALWTRCCRWRAPEANARWLQAPKAQKHSVPTLHPWPQSGRPPRECLRQIERVARGFSAASRESDV